MRTATIVAMIDVMKLLVLVCSTNDPSNSERLADEFLKGAKEACACEIQKIRLFDFPLPHFTVNCYEGNCVLPKEYLELRKAVREADGILIATPVWNFGVPSHLKNFIDWMGVFGLDAETHSKGQLHGKPFYFIFTGGAPTGAWKGLMRFTTMFIPESLRYFGGTIVGKFYEGHCTAGKGKFGLVVDSRPAVLAKVRQKGMRFAMFTDAFKNTGSLPLKHRTIEKIYRWGQRLVSKF